MAIKSALGDDGYSLWAEWSEQDASWNERDGRDVWQSIKGNGKVTIGTLYHEAQKGGFKFNGELRPSVLTPERSAWRKREMKQTEAREAQKHASAAKKARAIWHAAGEASDQHPYLACKQVRSYGLRLYRGDLVIKGMPCDGCLMVPARDASGNIHTLEFIHPNPRDGDNKRFLFGGDWKGCYFSIGEQTESLCICEGYATGGIVHKAIGYAVAVAFTAATLEPVARALRTKFPDLQLIVCADEDVNTNGNPGLTKATAAAHAINGLLAIPAFGNNRPEGATDFN